MRYGPIRDTGSMSGSRDSSATNGAASAAAGVSRGDRAAALASNARNSTPNAGSSAQRCAMNASRLSVGRSSASSAAVNNRRHWSGERAVVAGIAVEGMVQPTSRLRPIAAHRSGGDTECLSGLLLGQAAEEAALYDPTQPFVQPRQLA